MAKYSNTIVYNLQTNLDSRGIDTLRKKLSQVQTDLYKLKGMKGLTSNTKNDNALKLTDNKELEESYQTILKIQKALNSATNFSTGAFNTSTFLSDLQKMNVSAQDLVKTFSTTGTTGQQAFNQLSAALGSTEAKVSRMSTTVTKMFNTLQNTVRWGITASIFETASNSIGRAVDYVKDLDKSLNDIRIISGYNAEDMNKFADSANKAAQALGKTTTEYTNASLIYIQQGKTLKESNSLAELTLKTASVTGQATAEVSEQLTSLMNGYQISVDNMEASVDKLAKVAAVSASDMEELATAESKVASTANALGVSQDQLVSQLSTIISVTRQAPESVGNAMKTIYARLGDLQLGETLEDGTTLGTIGEALDEVGVNIQTATGDLRDMGDVIEELMGKWQDLDTAQKQALAVKLAGKYQYNNLMALLENSKMYDENLEAAQNSLGTINEQQQIYLDSLEGKLSTMQAAFEGFINSIFNVNDIKPFIDDITGLIQLLTGFTDSVGSTSLFAGVLGTGARVFSKNIGDQALNISQNRKARKRSQDSATLGAQLLAALDVDSSNLTEDSATYKAAKTLGAKTNRMNEQQRGQSKQMLMQMVNLENDLLSKREKALATLDKMAVAYKNVTGESIELKINEDHQVENLDQALLLLNNIKQAFAEVDETSDNISPNIGKLNAELNAVAQNVGKNKNGGFNKATRERIGNASISFDTLMKRFSTDKRFLNEDGVNIMSALPQYQAMVAANTALGEAVSKMPTAPGSKVSKTITDEVENAFGNARQTVLDFIEALQRLDNVDEKTAAAIKQIVQELGLQEGALNGMTDAVNDFSKSLSTKQVVAGITNIVGSMGQLIASFQSFRSLGSIWGNADLSEGEKLLHTIENLAFTLPMLVSASMEVGEQINLLVDHFKAKKQAVKQDSVATAENTVVTDQNTEAQKRANAVNSVGVSGMGSAASKAGKLGKVASVAGTIGKALPGIGTAIAVGGTIISVIAGIKSAFEEAGKAAKEAEIDKAIEKMNDASSETSSILEAKERVRSLYEDYKDGKDVYDDLTAAIQSLYEQLGKTDDIDFGKKAIDEYVESLNNLSEATLTAEARDIRNGIRNTVNQEDFFKDKSDKWKDEGKDDTSGFMAYNSLGTAIKNSGSKLFSVSKDGNEYQLSLDTSGDWSDIIHEGQVLIDSLLDGYDNMSSDTQKSVDKAIEIIESVMPSKEDQSSLLDKQQQLVDIEVQHAANKNKTLDFDSLSSDEQRSQIQGAADYLLKSDEYTYDFSTLTGEEQYDRIVSDLVSIFGEGMRSVIEEIVQGSKDEVSSIITPFDMVNEYWKKSRGEDLPIPADEISPDSKVGILLNDPDKIDFLKENNLSYDNYANFLTAVSSKYGLDYKEASEILLDSTKKEIRDAYSRMLNGVEGANKELEDLLDKEVQNIEDKREKQATLTKGSAYLRERDSSLSEEDANIETQRIYDEVFSVSSDILTDEQKLERFFDIVSGRLSEDEFLNSIKQTTYNVNDMAEASEEAKNSMANAASLLATQRLENGQPFDARQEQAGLDMKFLYGVLGEDIVNYSDEQLASMAQYAADAMEAGWSPENVQAAILSYLTTGEWTTNITFENGEEIGADQKSIDAYNTLVDQARKESEQKYGEGHYNDEEVASQVASVASQLHAANYEITEFTDAIADGSISLDDGIEAALQAFFDLKNGTAQAEQWTKDRIEREAQEKASQWQDFYDSRSKDYSKEYGASSVDMAMKDVNEFDAWLNEHGITKADFDAMGISTVGKTLEEIEQEVLDIKTGQADKDKKEEAEKRKETAPLRMAQNRYMEDKYGKGHVNQDELDESVDSVYDVLKKYNYSVDDLTRLGIDLNQDSSDIISDFLKAIDKTGDSADDAAKSFNELSGSLEEFTGLSDALDSRDSIQGLMKQADDIYTDEGRNYFTQDEAYDILKENPEYIKYLDEVEGGWQLNNRAVLEYEQAVLDAGKAMEELTGDAIDLSQQNQAIATVMSMDSSYTSEDGSGYLDQILTLNHALEDGSIQTSQFLDQISSQFDDFFSRVSAQAINAGQSIKEFFDNNDDAANMAQIFSDEMYQGIKQLNTQYQAGKITVGQYARSLATTATNAIKLKAAQNGLSKVEGEWVKVTSHGTVALKDMDKESKDAVKELETMEKSFDRLSAAADFSEYITDNFDEMTQVFSETGDVLESAKNELGGLEESFRPMIHGLAQEVVDFYKTDELALNAMSSQITAATGMMQDQAKEMLTSVDSLTENMMSSSAIAGAVMQGTMTQTQSAISNIATGISLIIQGVMSEISSIDAEVESQVTGGEETVEKIYQTNDKEGTSEEIGTIHIPGFKIRLSGKGSSNGAAGKSGGTSQDKVKNKGKYSFDSVMSTEDARNAGVYIAADAGTGPAVAVYKDGNGNYVGVQATDYQTGAWYLAEGTGQLFNNPGLSDYSPYKGGGGYTPKDNSSGGGGGGGGGNGSGSGEDLDTKDLLDDEYDRYKKINSQLDKMKNLLEQINKEQERLVGYNKFDYTKQATQNLKRQIELQKQKLELEKQERQEKQVELAKYGIKFDTEGYIDNYEDRFKFYLAEINSLIMQYNSASSKEEQEAIEERIEDKQEEFDKYKDLVDEYNDLNSNTIEQTKKEIQDLQDQIEDMITDIFNKAVEAVDTIKEVDDAVIDLKKTFRDFNTEEDDPFLSAEISDNKIANYFDAGTKAAKTFFDTAIARLKKLKDEAKTDEEKAKYQTAIDGLLAGQKLQGQGVLDANGTGYLDMALRGGQLILQNIKQYEETGKSDLFGENQQAMMEAAKAVFDQLTDMASNLREEIDNLRDSIIDAIDMVADEIEKREDLLDSISNRLDHLTSMSQILHGNTIQGYKEQNEILAVQSQLADQRLAEATEELDYWNKIASTVIQGSKEEEEVLNHVREATEKKNEAIENSVNLYKQQVQVAANLALAEWQKKWLGTDDMDWAQTQWEMMNRNADYYLDDVNKAYNIQKLQSRYTDLLDGANTLDIQTKITDQMNQQLEYLRTKTNLSEYDVSYAQAQLEILKQQIALEEAQANKSQMKLRRDSQGNYNYVYTANEDNVKSAQDGLLDAQNNAYNLSKDQMKQTQEDSFSAFQQAKQLLLDIWSDTTLGVEEQKERMKAVIDNLVQYLNMTGEQLSTSQANLLESFYGMVDSLNSENVGSLQEVYNKLKEGSTDAFDSIDTRWNTTITTLLQNKDKFADSMADLQKQMEASLTKYNTSLNNASTIAKSNIGDISDSLNGVKGSVDSLTDSFGLLTGKLQGYIEKIGGYTDKLRQYQNTFDSISQENGELRQTITDLQDQINKMKRQEAQGKNEGGIISTTPSGSSGKGNGKGDDGKGNGGFGGSGYARDDLIKGIALAIFNDGWDSGWGNDPVRSSKLIKAYGIDFAKSVQDYINVHWGDDSVFYEDHQTAAKFWSTKLVGYDTGGYTGNWSDGSGKLALLHSKEIVLNASDTQNILKAVESVRAMTAAMKGATLAEAVGSISSIGKSIETANSKVDQNVNITAEFPNATSADEIREAILGLNNQVLHYTHRKA